MGKLSDMGLYLAYGVAAIVILAYCIEHLISSRDDAREPPRLRARIPLIGHLLGIITSGMSYHSTLKYTSPPTPKLVSSRRLSKLTSKPPMSRRSNDVEIYTLGIFSFKLYTSVSTRLLPLIQRQSRKLSFQPMLRLIARKWGDASDETDALFATHLLADLSQAMRASLAPGPHLDAQNLRMASRALLDVDKLLGGEQLGEHKIWLLEWTRHAAMQASSCGVYGNSHPFVDPDAAAAFWKWHGHLSAHLSGVDFDIFRRGYAAREKVFEAHRKYCAAIPDDASQLFTERWRVLRDAGVSEADSVKQQAALPIGMLSNTVPTLYWTLWELFSRPALVADVRSELATHAVGAKDGGGFALDVAALKRRCPLLLSVLQETQRVRHVHAAVRKVMSDTLLDDGRYLLQKGHHLQMPGYAVHHSTRIWGPTAGAFDPYRFVTPEKKRSGRDFLAWGAPPHLCPARQFAATEILILVALLVMRADLEPLAGGSWEKAPALDFNDPVTMLNPKRDVRVKVVCRPEWDGQWTVVMSESTLRVPLASG